LAGFILPDEFVLGASAFPGDDPRVLSTKERQEAIRPKNAMEFDTEEALKRYLKEHPKADRAKHKVRPQQKDRPAKDESLKPGDKTKPESSQPESKPEAEGSKGGPEVPKINPGDEKKPASPEEVRRFRQEIPEYKLTIISGGDEDEAPTEADIKRAKAVFYQVKRGIHEAADICKMSPPVCEQNLGIERRNMPQIPEESVKKLLASDKESDRKLGQAAVDAGADPNDDRPMTEIFVDWLKKKGIKVTTGKKIPVGQLKATQREIKAGKTFSMADAYYTGKYDPTKKPIIVSSDGYILDGHHRWASMITADPSAEMEVIQIDMPMRDILEKSFEMPGVFRADLQGNPVKADEPLDLARKPGSLWQQRGKWYAKNREGKAAGPFGSKESAEAYAFGQSTKKDKMGRLEELRKIVAMEFPTEDALKKYLEDHPGADRSKHHVKTPSHGVRPTGATTPATKKDLDTEMLRLDKIHRQYGQPDLPDLDPKGQKAWDEIGRIQEKMDSGRNQDWSKLHTRLKQLGEVVERSWAAARKTPKGKKASGGRMTRLEELRLKVATQKVAFKPASTEFVEWVLLRNDRLTPQECQRFLEKAGLELRENVEVKSGVFQVGVKSGAFQVGEMVRVDKTKNANPHNIDACEKWHDNAGTIYDVNPDSYVVQFPNGERVQFMGRKPGTDTGLYRHTPATVADKPGRQAIELVYISDQNAPPPSKSDIELVQKYVEAGTARGEKRYDIYYSGLPASMGISKEGQFYFKVFTAQRSSPNVGDFPRTFNPTKGKVLYLGFLNRRPGGWENDLAKMRAQAGYTEPARTASDARLRAAVVKLAHDVPEMRRYLLPILARTK